MTGCVIVDILINAEQQPFVKAVVFVMELHHLIFLDTERSCERPKLSVPRFWLLKLSRQSEITFKGFRTCYRAVRGAAGGHWWLFWPFKDKNRFRRSDVKRLTRPTSDRYADLPPAAPETDSVGTGTSPALTIRLKRIRLESRKSCFPPPSKSRHVSADCPPLPQVEKLLHLPPTQLKKHPVLLATAEWPLY